MSRFEVDFSNLYRLGWRIGGFCFVALFLFGVFFDSDPVKLGHEDCVAHWYFIHNKGGTISGGRSKVQTIILRSGEQFLVLFEGVVLVFLGEEVLGFDF